MTERMRLSKHARVSSHPMDDSLFYALVNNDGPLCVLNFGLVVIILD